MRLSQHPDFRSFLVETARARSVPEQFVEKDYYVTAALRLVATAYPTQVIFKGGTSLSKGWGLITRFSEDIDLFLNPQTFTPALSKNRIEKELKRIRDTVDSHPDLKLSDAKPLKGGRNDAFEYPRKFGELTIIRPAIQVETGIQSGDFPVEDIALNSFVASFLRERAAAITADDLEPFVMRLLHFRRTFVEKMFALHSKVVRAQDTNTLADLGRNMRHYSDVEKLVSTDAVQRMLKSDEYAQLAADYDRCSKQFFPDTHIAPEDLRLRNSIAFFPPAEVRAVLSETYERECGPLFGSAEEIVPFDAVLAAIEAVRELI